MLGSKLVDSKVVSSKVVTDTEFESVNISVVVWICVVLSIMLSPDVVISIDVVSNVVFGSVSKIVAWIVVSTGFAVPVEIVVSKIVVWTDGVVTASPEFSPLPADILVVEKTGNGVVVNSPFVKS